MRNRERLFLLLAGILSILMPVGATQAFSGAGSGTEPDPYIITNVYQLQEMNNDLGAWYELGNDINASDTINWNDGEGFVPIGNSTNSFTGTFDGNNYNITDLFINRSSSDNQGLFGTSTGIISNVGLINVYVLGNNDVGGLAGYNTGTISNSYAIGTISGNNYVGGLIGHLYYGSTSNSYAMGSVIIMGTDFAGGLVGYAQSSNISYSYATASVAGFQSAGGLIGYCYDGTISNSYATGSVNGYYFDAGGLVGYARSSKISNSYATGSVNGYLGVGGLVGEVYDSKGIDNSYWDIETSGQTSSQGGEGKTTAEMKQQATFVGWDFVNVWTICEGIDYPRLLCKVPVIVTPNGEEFLTAGETYTITWLSSGSISNVLIEYSTDNGSNWTLINTVPNTGSYHWLVPEVSSNQCLARVSDASNPAVNDISDAVFTIESTSYYGGGSGTESDPYLIYTAGQMNKIGANSIDWDKHFKLMADIDLKAYTGTQFNIIGTYDNAFTGVFDGNNHTISNFTYTSSDNYVGLFRSTGTGSEIRNLGLINVNVNGHDLVGGLVGLVAGYSDVNNCYATGSVNGDYYVGGLVGHAYLSSISNSYASINARYPSANCLGGLIGYSENSNISNSSSTIYTSGSNWYNNVGGLIGHAENSNLENCSVKGNILYASFGSFGGLVATMDNGNISNSSFEGAISGQGTNVGGLVGAFTGEGIVDKSHVIGNIGSTQHVGAFLGSGGASSVSNSFFIGNVDAQLGAHGINGGEVSNCYFIGTISGAFWEYQYIGDGISGTNIANCYFAGTFNTNFDYYNPQAFSSGGVIINSFFNKDIVMSNCTNGEGKTTAEMKQQATFVGWDFVNVWTICEGIDYPRLLWQGIMCPPAAPADLLVTSEDINFVPVPGEPNQPVTISATIHNAGGIMAENFTVVFKDSDSIISSEVISSILPHDSNTVSIEHTWNNNGFKMITVEVDPYDDIYESDETNNSASKLYQVGDVNDMNAVIEISSNPPIDFYEGTTANISAEAFYRIKILGKSDLVYPVKGGSVSSYIRYSGQDTNLPACFTGTDGRFNISFPVPGNTGEVFDVNITVTDATLTGRWEGSFYVEEHKDLWIHSDDISFSGGDPNIAINALIHASPGNTVTVSDIPVTFYAYPPESGNQIGSTQYITAIAPDSNESASVTWFSAPAGVYCVEAVIGPGFSDDDNGNNKASRPLAVGSNPQWLNVDINTPSAGAHIDASDTTPVAVSITDNNGNFLIPCVLSNLTLDFNGVDTRHIDLKPYFVWSSSQYIYPWKPPTDANGQACLKVTARIADVLGDANGLDSICVQVVDNACPVFSISASPYWAKKDQSVWIIVESSEQLLNDQLDSIIIKDINEQPIQFSLVSHDPCSTRWIYQTVALPETTALGRATIAVEGIDLHGNTCTGQGYFYVVEDVPDFWIHSNDVNFSNENPGIGETIVIEAMVHAGTENSIPVSDIPVTFYARHLGGDYKIGDTQYTGQIIPGGVSSPVDVNWTNAACGWYIIEVDLRPEFSDRNYTNNEATRSLFVGTECDFDCDGEVDFKDLARLVDLWLWSDSVGSIPEDIIQDGTVNFLDYCICAKNWLSH